MCDFELIKIYLHAVVKNKGGNLWLSRHYL